MDASALFGNDSQGRMAHRLGVVERRAPREKSLTHHLTTFRRGHFSVLPDGGSNASPWIPSSCYLPATRGHFITYSHCHRFRVFWECDSARVRRSRAPPPRVIVGTCQKRNFAT